MVTRIRKNNRSLVNVRLKKYLYIKINSKSNKLSFRYLNLLYLVASIKLVCSIIKQF